MTSSDVESLWSMLWARRFGSEDVRLRFELGGEQFDSTNQSVPRFIQALHRSSTLADTIFHEHCVALVACNERAPNARGTTEVKNSFDALRSTGFDAPQIGEWQANLYPDSDNDEANVWTIRSYELSTNKAARDTILWHAIADEMPIFPSVSLVTFLVEPENSIMLHVYDDRGMDVMAGDTAKLRDTYSTFERWLLDYDRKRMDNLF